MFRDLIGKPIISSKEISINIPVGRSGGSQIYFDSNSIE